MEHNSTHRPSSTVEDPAHSTPASRSSPIAVVFLSLLGPLYALASNTAQAIAITTLSITVWYYISVAPDRHITAADYGDIVVYTGLSYLSAHLATSIFANIWICSIAANGVSFLTMDLYVRYVQAKREAARKRQKRDVQVAKYLGEPVLVDKDVSAWKVKNVKDIKGAGISTARKGPSTRRRG
jgi:hypothetical protein